MLSDCSFLDPIVGPVRASEPAASSKLYFVEPDVALPDLKAATASFSQPWQCMDPAVLTSPEPEYSQASSTNTCSCQRKLPLDF